MQPAGGGQEQVRAEVTLKYHHNGAEVTYFMRVTGVHTDCLDRQITEGVNISNFRGEVLMNRRGEMGGVRVDRQQHRRWGNN